MNEFYLEKALGIINKIHYATLATVSSVSEPYNAPVFVAPDRQLNFYWSSSLQSQHSQNIADNGRVYMVIYDSTVAQGTGWGVYIKAEASQVSDPSEAQEALKLLGDRRGRPFGDSARFDPNGNQRLYKAAPLGAWINDAKQGKNGEYIEDYRVPLDIDALKSSFTTVG